MKQFYLLISLFLPLATVTACQGHMSPHQAMFDAEQKAQRGDHAGALAGGRLAVQTSQTLFGPAHSKTASHLSRLAGLYQKAARYKEAEACLLEALAITTKRLGQKHHRAADVLCALVDLSVEASDFGAADNYLKQAQAIDHYALAQQHPDLPKHFREAGVRYKQQGQLEVAEALISKSLHLSLESQIEEDKNPVAPRLTSEELIHLADLYAARWQYKHALPLLQKALRLQLEIHEESEPLVQNTLRRMLNIHRIQRQHAKVKAIQARLTTHKLSASTMGTSN